MTPESVMVMGQEAMRVALMLAAPLLLAALVSGLFISLLQAATQILAVAATGIIAGPWMLNLVLDYIRTVFTNLPYIIG